MTQIWQFVQNIFLFCARGVVKMKYYHMLFLLTLQLFTPIPGYPITNTLVWQTPMTISTAGVNASDPKVCMAQSGSVIAAWLENGVVKSSSLPVNGTWSIPVTISGSGASSPKLGLDTNGNAVAIWLESGVVQAATKPAAGNWSTTTSLSGLGTATSPALAVDSTGNAVAVWVLTSVLNAVSLQASTRLVNGNWSLTPDTLSGSTVNPSSPTISIGANGTVYAVWHSTSSSNDLINSTSKTLSGGIWGTPINFFQGTATYRHNYPKVIVDVNGNATAVWFRYNQLGSTYTNVILLASQLPSGSTSWALPTPLSDMLSNRNPADLFTRLNTDNSGNIVVLWTSSIDGATFNIESASKQNGGSWIVGGALVLNNLYAFEADISTSSSGDASVALMYYDGSSIVIQSAESHIATVAPNFWGNLVTVSQGTNHGYPRIATALNTNTLRACALWLHNNGVNNCVEAITGSKNILAAPTNPTVTQQASSFGVFTDYNNTLRWTSSVAAETVGYVIYRNGVYVTTVGVNTLQYVDHNMTQNGAVTYGVAAFDAANLRSSIASISFP